jgi:hypothetical protein
LSYFKCKNDQLPPRSVACSKDWVNFFIALVFTNLLHVGHSLIKGMFFIGFYLIFGTTKVDLLGSLCENLSAFATAL